MTKILIKTKEAESGWEFNVLLSEDGSETKHSVSMTKDYYESLDTKKTPEDVVKKSFEFLLEREPKESILSNFDITLISKYFPEYDNVIKSRLF